MADGAYDIPFQGIVGNQDRPALETRVYEYLESLKVFP